jgi:hypothetical protein
MQEPAPAADLYMPARQFVQDAVLPALILNVPAGQSVQAPSIVSAVAATLANLPAGQRSKLNGEHEEAPAREYWPEVQVPVQVATCKPAVAPHVPAGQLLQVVNVCGVAVS